MAINRDSYSIFLVELLHRPIMTHRTISFGYLVGATAIFAMLSACGGGGGAAAPSLSSAATATAAPSSPVPLTADVTPLLPAGTLTADLPAPPVSLAPPCPPETCGVVPPNDLDLAHGAQDLPATPGYLVQAPAVGVTEEEPPYPDLRGLPTMVMPFEPISYGDVSWVSVKTLPPGLKQSSK